MELYLAIRRVGVTIRPEVGNVFDRLLATELALAEARRAIADLGLVSLDPTFDAWQASEGTDYQDYPEQLGRLRNRQAYDVWTPEIDREMQDWRTLDPDG